MNMSSRLSVASSVWEKIRFPSQIPHFFPLPPAAPALRTPLIAGSYATPFAMMGHHEMNGSLTSPGVYAGLHISPQMSAAAAAAYGRGPMVQPPKETLGYPAYPPLLAVKRDHYVQIHRQIQMYMNMKLLRHIIHLSICFLPPICSLQVFVAYCCQLCASASELINSAHG